MVNSIGVFMNCFKWADVLVVAENKIEASDMLANVGHEPERFDIEFFGNGDFVLELVDRNTLEPVDITVDEYADKFGKNVIELE